MATIANLAVGLSADSAQLKRDLDKAGASTKKWSQKQKKNFDGVTKSIKAMGLALGALASLGAIRGLTELAREITNLSNLTRLSTDELQSLGPALDHIGMSTEKYADILKDVNDKMHDFLQTGGGPMRDFFEQIAPRVGITADAFKDLSASDALGLYVKSLEDANLSQEEMTFYMEAIASDSTMLLPLLRNNAAEMTRLGLAAHQVVDQSVLNDLNNLGSQVRTIGTIIRNTLTNAFGPLIEVLSDAAEGWRMMLTQFPAIIHGLGLIAAAIGAVTVAMLRNPILAIVAGFVSLVTTAGFLYKKFMDVAEVVGGVTELFSLMKDAAAFEFRQIGWQLEALRLKMALAFNDIQDKWNATIGKMAIAFGEWIDGIASSRMGPLLGLEGGNQDRMYAHYAGRKADLTDDFIELSEQLEAARGMAGADNPYLQRMVTALGSIEENTSELPELPEELAGGLSDTLGAGAGAGGGGGRLPSATAEPTYFENAASDFVNNLKTSFSNALKSGDVKGFFTSVLDSFTSGIIDSFVEGLFAPLQESLTGLIGGIFSNMGGLGGGAAGGILNFFSGMFGAKDGGIVPTTPFSKSYADSVPTLLQPGELVVPKDQVAGFMSGAGGGGGQTFNINVTGDVSRATRSEIVRMMPEIAAGTNMINRENGGR